MKNAKLTALAALALTLPVAAEDTQSPHPSPGEIVAAAPASEWVAIPDEDLLVMTLSPDASGKERQVVIQLISAPFSQGWVENIRTFARAGWYDGITVNRVQDNYVVQWGDPNYDNPEAAGEAKPLPEGLKVMNEDDYVISQLADQLKEVLSAIQGRLRRVHDEARGTESEFDIRYLLEKAYRLDPYAVINQHHLGWPTGMNLYGDDSGSEKIDLWPVHCYGMVGVGRGYSPDTGSGAELYTVIGHAPRHLDRNIALVGRIISGMEHLSSLPRGSGALGFYTEEEFDKRTPIQSVRVASDLPEAQRPQFEYLSTEAETFARYAEARANRRDPFFIHPAGGADICNIPVPVRAASSD